LVITDSSVVPTISSNTGATFARLVGGRNPYEGRVEVFHGTSWGSICDDGWTGVNSGVICGMLGYSRHVFSCR